MSRFGLIACSKAKLDQPTQARELYTSPLFRAAQAYVRRHCDRYFILSAKHGLVAPWEVLAPYDVTLGGMGFDEKIKWANRVKAQLSEQVPANSWIELHAGAAYTEPLWVSGALDPYIVQDICHRMQLGERLHFYKLRAAEDARG